MKRDAVLLGAVAFGPAAVTIWDGFKAWFNKNAPAPRSITSCTAATTARTPTVRRSCAKLPNGKYVVAIGDVYVTNDPIEG